MLHLVDREILPKSPGDSYELRNLELSPLLGWGLVLLVIHEHGHQPVDLLVKQLEHQDPQGQDGIIDPVGFAKP